MTRVRTHYRSDNTAADGILVFLNDSPEVTLSIQPTRRKSNLMMVR